MSVDTRVPDTGAGGVIGAPVGRSRRRRRSVLATWLPPLGTLLVVLGVWYYISYVALDADRRFLLPPPHQVIQTAFLDKANAEPLYRALALSAGVAMAGLAIAIVLGMSVAVLMSQARWVERAVYPWAVVLQTIPILALVPLIGFWFDFGMFSRLLVVVLISIFPIISTTLFGLRSVEPANHDLFRLYGASRWNRLWKLQWPSALPSIVNGLRISAGLSVIGSVVGDFFFLQGEPGLGVLMQIYRQNLRSEQLFGAVILSSLLGLVVFWLFGLLGKWAVGSWHQTHSDLVAE